MEQIYIDLDQQSAQSILWWGCRVIAYRGWGSGFSTM